MLEIIDFNFRIKPALNSELLPSISSNIKILSDLDISLLQSNRELLITLEPKTLSILLGKELKRQDSHANQIASMNSLVALSNNCLDSLKVRALRSPVSR